MRLEGHEQSSNVEDRRGLRGPAVAGGSVIVMLILLALQVFDAPPAVKQIAGALLNGQQQRAANQAPAGAGAGIDDASKVFISQILRSTEIVWTKLFKEEDIGSYKTPKLIIFQNSVQSGCGNASAAMGPFYCPADQRVYIDPAFFEELSSRFKASGDFAQAYVIAHEVGHHVQRLTGFSAKVDQVRDNGDEVMTNQMSVRLELQADFLAGVWAHHAQNNYNILEEGDIEEGINAANRIGDDTLQMEAQGYKVPERYTHGTSAQRARWFKKGLNSGSFADCAELFKIAYERL